MNKAMSNKILELATKVGADKTICPSEVARALEPESWRELMEEVRETACVMHKEGKILITQKGETVKDFNFKGPIRLRLPE